MNKPILKWSPAVPIHTPDNIISSGAREKKQLGFTPTYENETNQDMRFLMSNEYQRMWFKERSKYEKDIYTREQIIKEESKIKRRICQRMMTYRKPTKNQFIEDKCQKSTEKDVDPILNYEKMKFKIECHDKKKRAGSNKLKPKGPKDAKESKDTKDAKDKKIKEEDLAVDEEDVIILCANVNNDCEEKN